MKPAQPLRMFVSAFVLTALLVPIASAHPGHDHGDIPSVIRHPLAGVEHVAVIAALVFVAAGFVAVGVKWLRGSFHHGARPRIARLR